MHPLPVVNTKVCASPLIFGRFFVLNLEPAYNRYLKLLQEMTTKDEKVHMNGQFICSILSPSSWQT